MENLQRGKLHLPLRMLLLEYRKKRQETEAERDNINDCVCPEAQLHFWRAYQLAPTN